MKHDAVRDGRHLMQNDEALLGHPASVYSIGDGPLCSGVCIATSDDSPDHPNYRYPQERTGDSTV